LHQQHDNPIAGVPFAKSFDLSPSEPKNIDLFTSRTGDRWIDVAHIVPGVNLRVPVSGKLHLTVMVNAEDVPKLLVSFAVWIDEDAEVQCELIPVTASTTTGVALRQSSPAG
jgi:hypothetical protein